MVDATRALLDELMGKDRNLPNEMRKGTCIRYDDPTVCKFQLAGLCPNRLFKNTRSDLGACPYEIHDDHIEWENIKADYLKEGGRDHDRYERKLQAYMDDLIKDMDKKILKAKERAEKESAPRVPRSEDKLRLDDLQARAKDALERSQRAGEEGDVDASMHLAQQAEDIKQSYEKLLRSATAPEKQMLVCDICGVFIIDNMDHLTGKQYLGWKAIREKFAEFTAKFEAAAASGRHHDREAHSSGRRRDDDYDRRGGGDRSRERERERSPRRDERRERDYGHRERGGGGGYDGGSQRGSSYSGSRGGGGYERDYDRRR